jgi:hypothetical protein
MRSYEKLKAEMETIQKQMVEEKKNKRADAMKEVKLYLQRVLCYSWHAHGFVG